MSTFRAVLVYMGALFSLVIQISALYFPEPASLQKVRRAISDDSAVYETRFPNVTWDNDQWRLTTTNLDQGHYQSRMSLANGYHGINVAALGPFFEVDIPVEGDNINGWPLFGRRQTFATVGGFWDSQPTTNGSNFPWLYQYGWDSAISGIPHWGGIVLDLGNSVALHASTSNDTIHNFTSTLDMKQGLMSWGFTWMPLNSGIFDVSYQMFVHRLHVNQGFVMMNVTSRTTTNVTVVNVLNGDCAVRTNATDKGTDESLLYTGVQPYGVENVTAYVYAGMTLTGNNTTAQNNWNAPYVGSNQSSIASAIEMTLQAGQPATFVKYVGIASSDGFTQPKLVARNAAQSALNQGYSASLQSHIAEWRATFPEASVDSYVSPENGTLPNDLYITEAAVLAVANPFHILQNTLSENATKALSNASINSHSISVGGLGSDSYAGQIFWDAEIWMQPGVVTTFPYAAQGIANYRIERYQQALANTKTAYQSSKNDTQFSSEAAVFPWTSGRFGNCTATGPCFDYEYHINGDIAQEFVNYWITSGDTEFFRESLYPIYHSIATFYSEVLQKNGSQWSLTNMTDPDEFANAVDNGGFTMPLIADTLLNANAFGTYFNQTPNTTWASQAEKVVIGRDDDANILLEYTGMNGTIEVKQADVVLVTFPLSYTGQNYTAQDSISDLDYYANKQSQDGPGMTYAIFSIIANQISLSGCSSYTYQQYSSYPYARAPWFQFSEQLLDNYQINGGFHPTYPFLTGHGGANQVVLFGYLGLRLIPDWHLHIDPALPPQIPQIRYRTFHWQGWPISAYSNQTHTMIHRDPNILPASGAIPNSTFSTNPIPVLVGAVGTEQELYQLEPNGTLVIVNRQPGLNKTIPGNIAQCQPVISNTDFIPGQFPIAAVDGASSTKWQPLDANVISSITVTVSPGQIVTGFVFDWAQAPPYNYSVAFHNTTGHPEPAVIYDENVQISHPYDPDRISSIVPVEANITTVYLNTTEAYGPDSGRQLYTAHYATLYIWGSQVNSSVTRQNMTGDGATVAEWSILVADNDGITDVSMERSAKRSFGKVTEIVHDSLLRRVVLNSSGKQSV